MFNPHEHAQPQFTLTRYRRPQDNRVKMRAFAIVEALVIQPLLCDSNSLAIVEEGIPGLFKP